MEEKEKYCSLLFRLCDNVFGAIKYDELQQFLPLNLDEISAKLVDNQFVVVVSGKFESSVYKEDNYFNNIDLLQRLVYRYNIKLKSENAVDKIEFQAKVLKLIKELNK